MSGRIECLALVAQSFAIVATLCAAVSLAGTHQWALMVTVVLISAAWFTSARALTVAMATDDRNSEEIAS